MRNVAPSWVRGLKLALLGVGGGASGRTLMGAWIETSLIQSWTRAITVAPSWVRGLKQAPGRLQRRAARRTLMGAWIETTRLC